MRLRLRALLILLLGIHKMNVTTANNILNIMSVRGRGSMRGKVPLKFKLRMKPWLAQKTPNTLLKEEKKSRRSDRAT